MLYYINSLLLCISLYISSKKLEVQYMDYNYTLPLSMELFITSYMRESTISKIRNEQRHDWDTDMHVVYVHQHTIDMYNNIMSVCVSVHFYAILTLHDQFVYLLVSFQLYNIHVTNTRQV